MILFRRAPVRACDYTKARATPIAMDFVPIASVVVAFHPPSSVAHAQRGPGTQQQGSSDRGTGGWERHRRVGQILGDRGTVGRLGRMVRYRETRKKSLN